ncbi:MAG: hypothetical protein H6Q92_1182 [Nitrospirae bacterium]|nr:hypothetical protein [Nitrospirota bacterium]
MSALFGLLQRIHFDSNITKKADLKARLLYAEILITFYCDTG